MIVIHSRDFHEESNKNAALKNAYVALSKQLYHKAACFLLLADRFQEAIQVIIKVFFRYIFIIS